MNDSSQRRPAASKPRPYRPVPKSAGISSDSPRPSASASARSPQPPSTRPPRTLLQAKPKQPSLAPPAAVLSRHRSDETAKKTKESSTKTEAAQDAWSLLNPVEVESPVESEHEATLDENEASFPYLDTDEPASNPKAGDDIWGLLDEPGETEEDVDFDIDNDLEEEEATGELHEPVTETARPSQACEDENDDSDDNSWGAWGKKDNAQKNEDAVDDESWGHYDNGCRGNAENDEDAEVEADIQIEGVASDPEADSDDAWGEWGGSAGEPKSSTDKDESWGVRQDSQADDQQDGQEDFSYEQNQRHDRHKGWENDPRSQLPIREKIHAVVPLLCGKERVCCVHGETGCGKSTQVPQILLEQAEKAGQSARIVVTQPRRVAALNLARRVAQEMGERDIGGSVGYRIGGENVRGSKIDFCTVGYMLQLLLHRPQEFDKYTHVVLDEVHERSAESDMLCLVVKLLGRRQHDQTRVIIMSATLQSDLFISYYAPLCCGRPPAKLHIKARCFPVEEFYLEDIKNKFGKRFRCGHQVDQRIKDHFRDDAANAKKVDQRHSDKYHSIILDLIPLIAEKGSTILVFLPGISEISSLWEEGRNLETRNLHFFPLHSMIPREEQELVFQEPDPWMTHVVLATDIAESSITLPHVVAVIDLGLHRRVDHDDKKGMAALSTKWISRAAAKQRSGRAGRTQPGICIRLYTRRFHDKVMVDFEPPESGSMALDRLYLQAKQMSEQLAQSVGSSAPKTAQAVLQEMVQPPGLDNISAARIVNAELGTLTLPTEEAKITNLGRVCLALPIEMRLARLVWLGATMGAVTDAVVLASVLSSQDPFSLPSMLFMRQEDHFLNSLRSSTSARLLFDGGSLSEPLMLRQLFLEWLVKFHADTHVWGTKEKVTRARRKHTEQFSTIFSLSRGRMEHVISHVLDLSLRTLRCCDWRSRAYDQLKAFIQGLGYMVNNRGDLAGINWEDWKPYKATFETDMGYLKGMLALAFSDQLLLGTYGGLTAMDATGNGRKEQLSQQTAILKAMQEKKLKARQTAVYADTKDSLLQESIQAVLACKKKEEKVKIGGAGMILVDFGTPDKSRWQALDSRPTGNLLDVPQMLVAEFNLLSYFEKNIRDMVNAKISTKWNGKVPPLQHPCLLRWEVMQQVMNQRGSQVRCEAVCEKRSALGFLGYVQELKPKEDMKRIAVIGVASSLRGGENPSRSYPSGVTALEPGHIGFILATARIETALRGLQRFGFTLQGALAILHRSVELPKGICDRTQWQLIVDLRQALRDELKVPEEWWSDNGISPVLYDCSVEAKARALWKSVKSWSSKPSYHMTEDRRDPTPTDLVNSTVALFAQATAEKPIEGPYAFWPLVPWKDLEKRRDGLIKQQHSKSQESKAAQLAQFRAQMEIAAAQKRAAAGPHFQQPPPKQPKLDGSSGNANEFSGRWIQMIKKAGSLDAGAKIKILATIKQAGFGLSFHRCSNGDHIGANLEGTIWKFCDEPENQNASAPAQAPTKPQAQTQQPSWQQPQAQKSTATPTPAQVQAQAQAAWPRPQPQAQAQKSTAAPTQPQAQPQAQAAWPRPQAQTQIPSAWNQKTAGVTFDPSAPVNSLTSLDLFFQIVSLKMVIWTMEEKNYVAFLMDTAFRKQGFFAPGDISAAMNCINQVRLVNPTLNLGGMVWPPGFPLPMGITQEKMNFRARFHSLIGELCRRSPVTGTFPSQQATSSQGYFAANFPKANATQAHGFVPPHAGVPTAPGFTPGAGGCAPGAMPHTGGVSSPGPTNASAATSTHSAFLPPREELLKLSASQLKDMIKQVGLSAAGCFEKSDLVDRLFSGPGDAVAKVAADVRGSSYTPGNSNSAPSEAPVDTSVPKAPTEEIPAQTEASVAAESATGSQNNCTQAKDELELTEGAKAAAALLQRRRAKKAKTAPATEQSPQQKPSGIAAGIPSDNAADSKAVKQELKDEKDELKDEVKEEIKEEVKNDVEDAQSGLVEPELEHREAAT